MAYFRRDDWDKHLFGRRFRSAQRWEGIRKWWYWNGDKVWRTLLGLTIITVSSALIAYIGYRAIQG